MPENSDFFLPKFFRNFEKFGVKYVHVNKIDCSMSSVPRWSVLMTNAFSCSVYVGPTAYWSGRTHTCIRQVTFKRRNAAYFFTFHTIFDTNTACKEICCNERLSPTAFSSYACHTRLSYDDVQTCH